MEYTIEPWETWPRKETPANKRKSPFKAGYQDTLDMLDKELTHLGAKEVTMQARTDRKNIRLDGQLRSDALVSHPGVIISFKRHGKHHLSMACDACAYWRDNIRAIALTLERLRLADLYGVTQSGEQYRGWEALPPPGAPALREMTKEQAADLIAKWSGMSQELLLSGADALKIAAKAARIKSHPDRGGHPEDAAEVSVAIGILEKEVKG